MKKVIFLVLVGAMGVSCQKEVCTSCVERYTQTPAAYCAKEKDVDAFENELKQQGRLYGQEWDCNRSSK